MDCLNLKTRSCQARQIRSSIQMRDNKSQQLLKFPCSRRIMCTAASFGSLQPSTYMLLKKQAVEIHTAPALPGKERRVCGRASHTRSVLQPSHPVQRPWWSHTTSKRNRETPCLKTGNRGFPGASLPASESSPMTSRSICSKFLRGRLCVTHNTSSEASAASAL